MARIQGRFERVAAAFDEVTRVRLCESSGSEHSAPESFTDLSDLVNSFLESDIHYKNDHEEHVDDDQEKDDDHHKDNEDLEGSDFSDSETKQMLQNLFFEDDHDNGSEKHKIYLEVEAAYQNIIGESSSMGLKRRLMTYLRHKGFDAGLCKSKWEKSKRYPAGDYEYIDVNVKGIRYIVEPFLAGQFEIARATNHYSSLLEIFPQIFIGKAEKLKKIVRRMCKSIKQSMKNSEMAIPPWRRNGYMQAKWFGSYKRTTNATPSNINGFQSNIHKDFSGHRSVLGFEAFQKMPCFCRDNFANKNINYGLRGPGQYLTATLNNITGTIDMQL